MPEGCADHAGVGYDQQVFARIGSKQVVDHGVYPGAEGIQRFGPRWPFADRVLVEGVVFRTPLLPELGAGYAFPFPESDLPERCLGFQWQPALFSEPMREFSASTHGGCDDALPAPERRCGIAHLLPSMVRQRVVDAASTITAAAYGLSMTEEVEQGELVVWHDGSAQQGGLI